MALVLHRPHKNSEAQYMYDHKRIDGRVHCIYIGRADNVKVVHNIPQKGYPVDAVGYEDGHNAGIDYEKIIYGEKRFQELQKHIEKVIPEGELAGSHTPDGKYLIHKNIDPKYHCQILTHERREHAVMTQNLNLIKSDVHNKDKQVN